jgi:RNA polymerase sigma factor (sigma-70 family)
MDDSQRADPGRVSDSDRELIEAFLAGDRAALAAVDAWCRAVIHHRAWRLSADLRDLLQECRLRLFRAFEKGTFRGRSSLKTFTQATAKHVCLDALRKAKVRSAVFVPNEVPTTGEQIAASRDNPTDDLLANEELRLCFEVLIRLPEHCRTLFQMILEEEKGYDEMAEATRLSIGTIKSRLSRCRDRAVLLRRALSGASGLPGRGEM